MASCIILPGKEQKRGTSEEDGKRETGNARKRYSGTGKAERESGEERMLQRLDDTP